MLINNKFEAQILTGNYTGNFRCHALASRALNMSCNFGQSARSIESRCVVNPSGAETRSANQTNITAADELVPSVTNPSASRILNDFCNLCRFNVKGWYNMI